MNNFYQRKRFFNPWFFFYDEMKTMPDVLRKSVQVSVIQNSLLPNFYSADERIATQRSSTGVTGAGIKKKLRDRLYRQCHNNYMPAKTILPGTITRKRKC